jgi:hypothetical protein
MTESMPRSEAPRRINGATEVGKSMPPAVHRPPPSRRNASSKAHWRARSSRPRRCRPPSALFPAVLWALCVR